MWEINLLYFTYLEFNHKPLIRLGPVVGGKPHLWKMGWVQFLLSPSYPPTLFLASSVVSETVSVEAGRRRGTKETGKLFHGWASLCFLNWAAFNNGLFFFWMFAWVLSGYPQPLGASHLNFPWQEWWTGLPLATFPYIVLRNTLLSSASLCWGLAAHPLSWPHGTVPKKILGWLFVPHGAHLACGNHWSLPASINSGGACNIASSPSVHPPEARQLPLLLDFSDGIRPHVTVSPVLLTSGDVSFFLGVVSLESFACNLRYTGSTWEPLPWCYLLYPSSFRQRSILHSPLISHKLIPLYLWVGELFGSSVIGLVYYFY